MTPALFALAALLLGALALRRARWVHVAAYVGSLACVGAAIWFALGAPRPAWLGHKPGLTVLAMAYQEGSYIALWTQNGQQPPVAYVLPWSEIVAAQAQAAMEAAKKDHGTAQWGQQHGNEGAAQGKPSARGHGGAHASGLGGAANGFSVVPHQALPPKEVP